MGDVDVSVVIVSYRTPALTEACVASVVDQTAGVTYEVLVVDNAPGDGTAPRLRARFPDVRLLEPGGNAGFARAVNLAAAFARGRQLLLLNPDTVVLDGAVQRLSRFADEHPGHGLYGGRTVDAAGRVDPRSCWGLPTLWSTFCFASGLSALGRRNRVLDPESLGRWARDSVREVGVVTGCLCLVPTDVWRELGGFDERFFVYGEDVDLGLRARAAGYRPLISPDAVVRHEVGASSGSRVDKLLLLHRGKATLLRKHWGRRARLGVTLLRAGVALRGVRGDGPWRELHRRRREWVHGFPVAT